MAKMVILVKRVKLLLSQLGLLLQVMQEQMLQWMHEHGYESIAQFKGRMNLNADEGGSLYGRTQFMKYFSGHRSV